MTERAPSREEWQRSQGGMYVVGADGCVVPGVVVLAALKDVERELSELRTSKCHHDEEINNHRICVRCAELTTELEAWRTGQRMHGDG